MKTTLLIGGARSGKSRYAQGLALETGGTVLFAATAEPGDEEMKRRIEAHRRERPPGWKTIEATTDVGRRIAGEAAGADTVIVDCITLLVSNIMQQHDGRDETTVEKAVEEEIDGLLSATRKAAKQAIIVSNEAGLGLVPADPLSRLYRDLLGKANQRLAARADEVVLMVAGLPVKIKPS